MGPKHNDENDAKGDLTGVREGGDVTREAEIG
jgi:hypothetical protein